MKRGDLVIVQQPGTLVSKARPCLIIQGRLALPPGRYLTICPLTSVLNDLPLVRIQVVPTPGNGLEKISDVEVDLVQTVPTSSVGATIGTIGVHHLALVDAALRRWLDL